MPVTQTPQRFSGVGVIADGPILPSGPLTPARPPLKPGALPLNENPDALKPLLPARMSSMRLFRLAVCTFASETPTLKIEDSASGEIRPKSLQSLLSGSSSRKAISVDARGSPIALSSAFATATVFGVQAPSTKEPCVPSSTTAFERVTTWACTMVRATNDPVGCRAAIVPDRGSF